MGRKKSPQLKKQDEYDKDFRTRLEHPHAFRKNWPKKKARANRRERAAVRVLVASKELTEVTAAELKNVAVVHPQIRKSCVMSLRERIKNNVEKRQKRRKLPSRAKMPKDG